MVGGIGGYRLHFTALSKTLWRSQNLCTTAWRNKQKRSVKGEEEFFLGRHGGQASLRWEREGLEKGNTWLWFGGRECSVRHIGRTYLVVNKKHIVRKNDLSGKKSSKKK